MLKGMTGLLLLLPASMIGQEPTITVTEVTSTIGRSDAPFSTISDMVVLSHDQIVVADSDTPAIWVWTPSSGSVRRVARKGDGPGEVKTPVQLDRRPGGGFALYDNGHSSILLYSADLEFEDMARVGFISNPKDLLVLSDGSFVVAGGRLADPSHLHHFNVEGDPVRVWGDPEPGVQESTPQIQIAGGVFRKLEGDRWLFAQRSPYRILEFPAADLLNPRRVIEDSLLIPEPTDDLLRTRNGNMVAFKWWSDHISGIVRFDDGRTLTVVTRFYSGDSVWSVHDSDGKLVSRSTIDRAYDLHDQIDDDTLVGSYRDPVTDERVAVVLNVVTAG